uniref:uncharacterized protein n=2 Tax=Myxine glutinosa TaxID=7769 RepID=UPI00358EEE1F
MSGKAILMPPGHVCKGNPYTPGACVQQQHEHQVCSSGTPAPRWLPTCRTRYPAVFLPGEPVIQPFSYLSNPLSSRFPTCRTRAAAIFLPGELVIQLSSYLGNPCCSHLPTWGTRSAAIFLPGEPVLQPSSYLGNPFCSHLPTWGTRYLAIFLPGEPVIQPSAYLSNPISNRLHLRICLTVCLFTRASELVLRELGSLSACPAPVGSKALRLPSVSRTCPAVLLELDISRSSLCTGRAGMKVAIMALSMFFLNVAQAKEKQQQQQQQQHEENKVEEVKRRVMGPKKPPQTLSRGWGDGLDWIQTYEQALFLCQKIGKPLMVIHHLDECPYSQALKKAFAASDDIQTMAEDHFIMLNVMHETVDKNLSPDGTYVPRIIFIDPSLTVRADITSRYKNRLYTYEPEDIALLIENMKTAKQLLKSEL